MAPVAGCTSAPDPAPPPTSAPSGGVPTDPTGPGGTPPPAGSSAQEITVDGYARTYRVYRPANLPTDGPVPLVVMLHGLLGSGEQAESWYGWNSAADAGGFVVAYPDSRNRAWAVSPECCGVSARDGVDDTAFVAAVVESLRGRLPVDPRRTYVAGISNGGMLAYRLACDTSIFAAVVAVSSTMLGDCPAPEPISVLHIHGTADETIPYTGGPGRWDGAGRDGVPGTVDGPPVPDLAQRWRQIDQCAAPRTSTEGTVTTVTASCPEGRAVTLITIAGAGHQWPGSRQRPAGRLLGLDRPATELDATATGWQFFASHPRPA
ncbi:MULTISPECIES: alpha/beta hydrolase family esterase [unclassified Solwaraspora]|uniref:alpha/beta hydrolase family esterase n=1 Tax=unclassified Solwaraspora TaxID=2627926 RepID=UPI00259B1E32|nr:alpha/beta fold hydrolase [Solwaraspora sp. WMMA2056]WJK38507.1 alpha/beta fold hydrolase [Solwaraspora sp. WMMA2056]